MHAIGDIGGTHIRLAAFEGSGQAACLALLEDRHEAQKTFDWDQVPDLPAALHEFHQDLGVHRRFDSLTLAFAGPALPDQQVFRFTNQPQKFFRQDLHQFADQVSVINDFAAQASLIPHLPSTQLREIKSGQRRMGARAVLGPGTGLGVAGLMPDGQVIPGEGGNVTLPYLPSAPLDKINSEKRHGGQPRLEDALSGQGLENIYAAQTGARLPAAEISRQALAGQVEARDAFTLFFDFAALGAANQALQYMASGGVFFVGAIFLANQALLDLDRFARVFCSIETHADFLASIPVYQVLTATSGLAGAAAYAASTYGSKP